MKARLPILQFLQEKIMILEKRREDVRFKIRSLRDALQRVNDEEERDAIEYDETDEQKGMFGTILHTACAISNFWLVELLLKALADATALDYHGWTAEMIVVV